MECCGFLHLGNNALKINDRKVERMEVKRCRSHLWIRGRGGGVVGVNSYNGLRGDLRGVLFSYFSYMKGQGFHKL